MTWASGTRMSSRLLWRLCSRWSWGGLFFTSLLLALFLTSLPLGSQSLTPSSRLSPTDYLTFQVDSAIRTAHSKASSIALVAATQKVKDLEQLLLQAQQAQGQQQQNSDDSSKQQTAEILSLKQQLKETKTTVDELRKSLASAAPDLTADLGLAQARAKSAEQALTFWRITSAVAIALAAGAGVYAAVK